MTVIRVILNKIYKVNIIGRLKYGVLYVTYTEVYILIKLLWLKHHVELVLPSY